MRVGVRVGVRVCMSICMRVFLFVFKCVHMRACACERERLIVRLHARVCVHGYSIISIL